MLQIHKPAYHSTESMIGMTEPMYGSAGAGFYLLLLLCVGGGGVKNRDSSQSMLSRLFRLTGIKLNVPNCLVMEMERMWGITARAGCLFIFTTCEIIGYSYTIFLAQNTDSFPCGRQDAVEQCN